MTRKRLCEAKYLLGAPVLLLMAAVFTAGAFGQATPDFSKVEIKVTKVAGNVYMLQGQGGNITALVGDDGILLVDDEYAPLADKIRAALKGIGVTDKPVRFVINTHYHPDHTGGNLPFAETAVIIAHDNARTRMAEAGFRGNRGSIHRSNPVAPQGALPVITYGETLTVHFDGEEVRVWHPGRSHTDGDSIVTFHNAHVVATGDDFVRYGFPFIDLEGGGRVKGMTDTFDQLIPQLPADVKIIPGHGELANLDDLRAYVKMLKDTTAVVEQAVKQGKTLDQMRQEKLLDPWRQYSSPSVSTDAYLETLYYGLIRTSEHQHMTM
jgi:cyclase